MVHGAITARALSISVLARNADHYQCYLVDDLIFNSKCSINCFEGVTMLNSEPEPGGKRKALAAEDKSPTENWFYGSHPKRPKSADDVPSAPLPKVPPVFRHDHLVEISLGPFKTFPKQRLAVEKLLEKQKIYKNSRIFNYELERNTGERRYMVMSLERFWPYYEQQQQRNMYELIYENDPCRLYFDLEYDREPNKDIDHQAVYNHFCETLKTMLFKDLEIELDVEKDLLVLDASSDKKFSAHVICHLKDGMLFPSSSSLRLVSNRLTKQLLTNPPCPVWNSDRTKQITLFDAAVYSKNRNFRMFLSSKLGQNRVLRLADYCHFYGSRTPSDREVFFDSLCVPADCHRFAIVDLDWIDDVVIPCGPQGTHPAGSSRPAEVREGQGASPYPQLDEFMLMVLRKWNSSVYLRQWKLTTGSDGQPDSITYYPANCRYCFNIGRQHKSNGTYWTIVFSKLSFFQKCFDPECGGRSSNLFPLPAFIAETLKSSADMNESSFTSREEVDSFFDQSHTEVTGFFTDWDQVFDC